MRTNMNGDVIYAERYGQYEKDVGCKFNRSNNS